MTVFTANSTAAVLEYVLKAANGDVIQLAPGRYDGLRLSNVVKSGAITITSQDTKNPAVLTNFSIQSSAGLNLSDLEVYINGARSMTISGSNRINLDGLNIHGTINGSSSDDITGLIIREGSRITVSNTTFHELSNGLVHTNLTNTIFDGNNFSLIRENGISGGGSSQITVSNNFFTNFDHQGVIHPDAIQFWTTNTTTQASDITVSGNVFDRGEGSIIQGIWITDDVGTLPYKNVTVTNNVIVGASYHGITVSHADKAYISNNVVIAADGQQSWIGIMKVAKAIMTDNVATSYVNNDSKIGGNGNVLATAIPLSATGGLGAWLADDLANAVSEDWASEAAASVFDKVDFIGFYDKPSKSGLTYDFTVMELNGTTAIDRLVAGKYGAYHLSGLDGADVLVGNSYGFVNVLEGGRGNDSYNISQSIDTIVENFSEGIDTVYSLVEYTLGANVENLRASTAGLRLTGNGLDNNLVSVDGGGSLFGLDGNDLLQGDSGIDLLYGGNANDRLLGNGGADYLNGGEGDDRIQGGDGDDSLFGGLGDDYLEGGPGADILTGDSGADIFAYRPLDLADGPVASMDTIRGFSVLSGDKISLSSIDADSSTPTRDRFKFIGAQSFDGVSGELRYEADKSGITIYGDTNGDCIADFAIRLVGTGVLGANSFIL